MRREDGPAIRDTLIWFAAFIVSGGLGYYFWGSWAAVPFFIIYGVALRLFDRQPLARVRPSHRLQDAMDERRGLSDRLLHDHARADDLALEPYPPPHRYHHRRARSRDHHAASARRRLAAAEHLRAQEHVRLSFSKVFLHRERPADRGGGDLRARERAVEGLSASRASTLRSTRAVIVACFAFRSILPAMYIGLPSLLRRVSHDLFRRSPSISASPRTCSTIG